MAARNPTPENPSDNLIEAANVLVSDQPDLNAVRCEVVDQAGAGFALLVGPEQTRDLIANLITALDRLRGWPMAGPLSSTF